MTDRRRQRIVIRPDQSWWDEQAFADLMASWDRRAPKRATVERLSRKGNEG